MQEDFLKGYKTAGTMGTVSLTAQHQWTKGGGSRHLALSSGKGHMIFDPNLDGEVCMAEQQKIALSCNATSKPMCLDVLFLSLHSLR